jgi:hypothetical protein
MEKKLPMGKSTDFLGAHLGGRRVRWLRAMPLAGPSQDNPTALVGVSMTRVGGGYGLKVNLRQSAASALPDDVDGVPITTEVVGEIKRW